MKKAVYLVVLVASVTAAFVIGSLTSGLGASPTAASRPIHHYACPMHPTYTSAHPGTAPCCGMAYEAVYAEATKFDREGDAPARRYMVGTVGVGVLTAELTAAGVGFLPVDEDDVYTKYEATGSEWFQIEH